MILVSDEDAILCDCCHMPFCTLLIVKVYNYVELEIKLKLQIYDEIQKIYTKNYTIVYTKKYTVVYTKNYTVVYTKITL